MHLTYEVLEVLLLAQHLSHFQQVFGMTRCTHCVVQDAEEKENQDFKYGACAMQGWRTEMVSYWHLAVLHALSYSQIPSACCT